MLVAFRLFLFAAGLVVLALVVTARGLVPEPDVRTRIGEVPSVGRSLVQQAIVPPAMIGRQSSGPEGKRAEAPTATSEPSDLAAAPAPGGGVAGNSDERAAAPEPRAAAEPGEADLVTVNLTEPPGSAEPSDIARAPPSSESLASSAEALEPLPVVAPDGAAATSATDAKDNVSASASAGPPALAFAAEPASERKTLAGERPGAAPAKAKPDGAEASADVPAGAIGPDSDTASETAARTRSSKSTSKAKATKRKVAARSIPSVRKAAVKPERKVVIKPRKKVKVAHRSSRRPARQPETQQWIAPNDLPATPQTYQYLYTAPAGENDAPSPTTSVQ
jgi:hypothetical protein